ncbi:MAG: alpha/beta fold hydrolase, partial [Candidatus Binatia bacterium]
MNFADYMRLRTMVTTEFGDFDYLDVGQGSPTVFIQGIFVSAYLWRGVIERLQGERRCIAYNLPAHGRTRVAPAQD